VALVLGPIALIMVVALGASLTTLSGQASACGTATPPVDVANIPSSLMPIYEQAAARYGLAPDGWAYLASINYQETNFGQNLSTSSAGAIGWMQFEPGTWRRYAVSADPSKPGAPPDPHDPWDAIFSAANYLRASGAPGDWMAALTIYGNARWYATEVQARAGQCVAAGGGRLLVSQSSGCAEPVSAGGYVNPFAHATGLQARRIDMGVDYGGSGEIDTLGDARVVYAGTHIGGNWTCSTPENGGIVYQLTDGQYRGDYIYVTEDVTLTVQAGPQILPAGTEIATFTAPTGCLEIGWASGPSPAPQAAALCQQAGTGDAGDNRTYCGEQMSELLAATGVPAGQAEGRPVTGSRCE
jgi:hypothetical protein